MAQLAQSMGVYNYSTWSLQQRNFYNFFTGSGSPSYIHMKLNLGPSIDTMYMIEAVGFNYGNGTMIRCAWGFQWSYGPAGYIANVGLQNIYGGMSAHGVYKSTDGYCVIRAYANSHYYNGFMLNGYATRTDTTHYQLSVTAAVQTDNAGNYY
jgi:hypothetical protein